MAELERPMLNGKPMRIGNLTFENPVFLAPMAGVTDMAYRILAREMGCPLVYSEMVSDKGIKYRNEHTLKMLVTDERERPMAMQLFGEDERLLDEKARARHRLIGQVFDTYWMVEYDGKLFIIDQHAAHEKVLYEKLMKAFSQKALQKQMLSPPVILTLSMQEENIYKQYADYFAELGFEIELFGGREYAVRGVPLQLFGMNARDIFIEVLDSVTEESRRLDGSAITDHIATMACKAAVKGNNKLSFKEADTLIEQLLQAKNPYTCPHGRPTIISLSKYELEKKFKRIQS